MLGIYGQDSRSRAARGGHDERPSGNEDLLGRDTNPLSGVDGSESRLKSGSAGDGDNDGIDIGERRKLRQDARSRIHAGRERRFRQRAFQVGTIRRIGDGDIGRARRGGLFGEEGDIASGGESDYLGALRPQAPHDIDGLRADGTGGAEQRDSPRPSGQDWCSGHDLLYRMPLRRLAGGWTPDVLYARTRLRRMPPKSSVTEAIRPNDPGSGADAALTNACEIAL